MFQISLWSRLMGRRRLRLDQLPEDILVDLILTHLSIKDLLSLRRVNRTLCALTKKPNIWKRFLPELANIQIPLAPLPPSANYNVRNLTGSDIERAVIRSISLEYNWRKESLKPFRVRRVDSKFAVEDMVLLPGGHFLVCSVRDVYNEYGVMVWVLDHPKAKLPIPLCFRETEVKPYFLQAKYATVRGQKGICIAFLRKKHKVKGDKRQIPEAIVMGGPEEPEDPFMPLKYECTTLHISLDALDKITTRRLEVGSIPFIELASMQKDAIQVVSRIRTGTQLGALSLDEIEGEPHVCVVKRPDTIVFENLNNNDRSSLKCRKNLGFPTCFQSIWNFRVAPLQRHVFTFRFLKYRPEDAEGGYVCLFEMYRLPPPGTDIHEDLIAIDAFSIRGPRSVQISQINYGSNEDDQSISSLYSSMKRPPPLVFYVSCNEGVAFHPLWPRIVQLPPSPPDTPDRGVRFAELPPGTNTEDVDEHIVDYVNNNRHKKIGTINKATGDRILPIYDFHEERDCLLHGAGGTSALLWRILPGSYRSMFYQIPIHNTSVSPPIKGFHRFGLAREGYTHGPDGRPIIQGVKALEIAADEAELWYDLTPEELATHQERRERREEQERLEAIQKGPGFLDWFRKKEAVAEQTEVDNSFWGDGRKVKAHKLSILAPMEVPSLMQTEMEKGVTAICWDEDSGRMCVATKKEDNVIHIVDCGFLRRDDGDDDALYEEMEKMMDMEVDRTATLN